MISYDFTCTKCQILFEELISIKEYDEKAPLTICPKCKHKDNVKRVYEVAPDCQVKGNNTFGAIADKNAKKMGKQVEEIAAKKRESNKPQKRPWYGTLPKDKQKKIFKETDKAKQQETIKKYIMTGE